MAEALGQVDASVLAEVDEALALLDVYVAKVPQPGIQLLTAIDLLRRTRGLIGRGEVPAPRAYALIAGHIRGFFLHRRVDGAWALVLPEEVGRKLVSLSERAEAMALSIGG